MTPQINLIQICRGHLTCNEDKCLRCRISENNKSASCYSPVFLNREYEGRSAKAELRTIKRAYQNGNHA